MLSTIMCLATAIYFEARGEPLEGKYAVAEVVINRTLDERFPDNACAVIHEEKVPGKCQFSFACDGDLIIREPEAFATATAIATVAYTTETDYAGGAVYFHTKNVSPRWARRMKVTADIGDHVFLDD